MATNDVVLLDSLVERARARMGSHLEDSELFELFCFEQTLKEHDLSYEELESGWTDGTDDGGIDGFFVLVDGQIATKDSAGYVSRKHPEIDVVIISVRRTPSFQLEVINALYTSVGDLLDLTKGEENLSYPYRPEILEQRELFRAAFLDLADRRPKLKIRVLYCSRGDTGTLAKNLLQRIDLIRTTISQLFSDVEANVECLGGGELLQLARKERSYSLRLRFAENYISREGLNYVVLVTLSDYLNFVRDEEGQLRRYLFESNVRDYLGQGAVNKDITETLERNTTASTEDFWWLNNGVTMLATHATVAGKELSIENVQIVNGLQTTETIYSHFTSRSTHNDQRAILIKIILAKDDSVRARIIKATNYQSTVDFSSLRGLDKIQLDIEHYFADRGWWYDRKRSYYKNQGRPSNRIISMAYLAAAVRAIALGDPASSPKQRARSLRDDITYEQVFNSKWDLSVYLASLEITRAVELVLEKRKNLFQSPIALVHYVAYVYACSKLGRSKYRPNEVGILINSIPTADDVLEIRNALSRASTSFRGSGKVHQGVKLNKDFIESYVDANYGLR